MAHSLASAVCWRWQRAVCRTAGAWPAAGSRILFGRGFFDCNALRRRHAAARTLNQQRAQVSIATATDMAQPLMSATGILAWHQPHPCSELPTVLEIAGVARTGDDRIGGDSTNAGERAHASATLRPPSALLFNTLRTRL